MNSSTSQTADTPEVAAALDVLNSGRAGALQEAMAALERAGAEGNGEALARLSYLKAAGLAEQPDWDQCLAMLRQAAELGWARAQEELQTLAQGDAAVDLRAFVAPRHTEVVSTAPRIRTVRGLFSPAECAWVVARGRTRLEPATVYTNEELGSARVAERSNSGAPFQLQDLDLALIFLRARISNTIGLPLACFEPAYLLHYAPGEAFAPHHDYLDNSKPGLAADIQQRGQRVATILVYLNTGYGGGETEFPELGYKFKGGEGDALIFANVDPNLAPDPRTLHAGLPPTSGEKWLLSQWARNVAQH
ncbi:MAG: 2OG-Fe(II) oxygenase [Hyphomonadaceae bacterium]